MVIFSHLFSSSYLCSARQLQCCRGWGDGDDFVSYFLLTCTYLPSARQLYSTVEDGEMVMILFIFSSSYLRSAGQLYSAVEDGHSQYVNTVYL